MKARLIVFPIKGRNWCFSRSVDRSPLESQASQTPSTIKDLWKRISSSSDKFAASNAELVVDFAANKMNNAWAGLEKAPAGTLKNRIHGLGLRLLSGVKPSEIFLKSITDEVSNVEVVFPPSVNARLVRRRLRHIAMRGTAIHKNYFYGSATLLPLTSAFMVLPLPNVPFFWVLFRTYSHWRAFKGSEKLLKLVSENQAPAADSSRDETTEENPGKEAQSTLDPVLVMKPSEELEKMLEGGNADEDTTKCTVSEVCKSFDLNKVDVLKYLQKSLQ